MKFWIYLSRRAEMRTLLARTINGFIFSEKRYWKHMHICTQKENDKQSCLCLGIWVKKKKYYHENLSHEQMILILHVLGDTRSINPRNMKYEGKKLLSHTLYKQMQIQNILREILPYLNEFH